MMDERAEIVSRVGAFATHVDAQRWEHLLGLFAADVQVDYTSLFGSERQSMTREQLISGWRQLLPGFTRTTHLIGSPSASVSGETAQVSASVVAWHFINDPVLNGRADLWLVGGCYEIVFNKRDDVWRISALTLANAWSQGNLDLPGIARQRAMKSTQA
jgi:hypothetical protein